MKRLLASCVSREYHPLNFSSLLCKMKITPPLIFGAVHIMYVKITSKFSSVTQIDF